MGTDDQQPTPPADETTNASISTTDTHDIPDEQALALFEAQANERIRKVFMGGRWWYSAIDTVALLAEPPDPRTYWFDMK